VCCRVLQGVAVCFSVLRQHYNTSYGQRSHGRGTVWQCAAVCCIVLQCAAVCCSVLQCAAMCCNVLQCAAGCCTVLQCVALFCSVLQCVLGSTTTQVMGKALMGKVTVLHCVAACGSVLQRVVHESTTIPIARLARTYCNTLQHTTQTPLQHTTEHYSTLQLTAAHCNSPQHTATHRSTLQLTAAHCNSPQHTATHCNTGNGRAPLPLAWRYRCKHRDGAARSLVFPGDCDG